MLDLTRLRESDLEDAAVAAEGSRDSIVTIGVRVGRRVRKAGAHIRSFILVLRQKGRMQFPVDAEEQLKSCVGAKPQ